MPPNGINLFRLFAIAFATFPVSLAAADGPGDSLDSSFERRNAVNRHLRERITAPLPGTKRILPVDDHLEMTLRLFPDREFIEHTLIKQRDWSGGGSANIILQLDEKFLAQHKQGNSQTMTATVLLEHYLAGLEKLGFRSPGTPGCAASVIQMANDYRFIDGDPSITVHATVFVAPKERQAIIRLETRERLR